MNKITTTNGSRKKPTQYCREIDKLLRLKRLVIVKNINDENLF